MKKVRAVVCDVYRTILDVLPPPADAGVQWEALCDRTIGCTPVSLDELSDRCRGIVGDDHAIAKARGVLFPEVVWPDVMLRALPELSALDSAILHDFIYEHMQLVRALCLMPGAANVISRCRQMGIELGIASNAQHYTGRELAGAFEGAGLSVDVFDPELCLWSWQMGFSKPNPHVFQILTARLGHRGIAPDEILMIGDRMDNDIEPARVFGWQTVRIDDAGGWQEAAERLFG